MSEDTAAISSGAEKMEDTAAPSTSADQADGEDVTCEAKRLMGAGHRHLVMKDVRSAVSAFQEASSLLAKKYGETADECADAFYSYGMSLLELARMENGVLGNALEGMPEEEDGEKEEDPNIPSADNLDEKEREQLREQVYDAMAEEEKTAKETPETEKGKPEDVTITDEKTNDIASDRKAEKLGKEETEKGTNDGEEMRKGDAVETEMLDRAGQTKEGDEAETNPKDGDGENEKAKDGGGETEKAKDGDMEEGEKAKDGQEAKDDKMEEGQEAKDDKMEEGEEAKDKMEGEEAKDGEKEEDVKAKDREMEEKGKEIEVVDGDNKKVEVDSSETNSKNEGDVVMEECAKADTAEKSDGNTDKEAKNELVAETSDAHDQKDVKTSDNTSEGRLEVDSKEKEQNEVVSGEKPVNDAERETDSSKTEVAKKDQSSVKSELKQSEDDKETEDQEQMEEGEEDEGVDSEENEDAEEKETEEEDVGNLQLAWEMLDLSKIIFKRQQAKDAQLKAAQAHLKLGEVSVESENYSQAVEDFLACLSIQKEHLEEHDRLLAETHYHLGLAYQYSSKHEDAVSHFTQSIGVIEKRMAVLAQQIDAAAGVPVQEVQKEMDELKDLLPDIKEKIEDSKEAQKNAVTTEIALKATLAGSSGFSQENGSTSASAIPAEKSGDCAVPVTNCVSDISHLVRKKRKPEEESPLKEAKKPKQEMVENGAENGDAVVPTNEEAEKAEEVSMETAAMEGSA